MQFADLDEEAFALQDWFGANWDQLRPAAPQEDPLLALLDEVASRRSSSLVYFSTPFQLFKDLGEEINEDRIIKSAAGIRDTIVWKKLFRFQRDGVIGAIDKLERIGGCIIADSVGLGKTFSYATRLLQPRLAGSGRGRRRAASVFRRGDERQPVHRCLARE